jgi:hypothetical protein
MYILNSRTYWTFLSEVLLKVDPRPAQDEWIFFIIAKTPLMNEKFKYKRNYKQSCLKVWKIDSITSVSVGVSDFWVVRACYVKDVINNVFRITCFFNFCMFTILLQVGYDLSQDDILLYVTWTRYIFCRRNYIMWEMKGQRLNQVSFKPKLLCVNVSYTWRGLSTWI